MSLDVLGGGANGTREVDAGLTVDVSSDVASVAVVIELGEDGTEGP